VIIVHMLTGRKTSCGVDSTRSKSGSAYMIP